MRKIPSWRAEWPGGQSRQNLLSRMELRGGAIRGPGHFAPDLCIEKAAPDQRAAGDAEFLIYASVVYLNAARATSCIQHALRRSAADHPLNLCDQLIQIERLGHDFHAVLHAAVANGCVLGIAG